MESKIRLPPLYPIRLKCKITHSSSSKRLCQYQRTTKASWGGCTRLHSALVRFNRFRKKLFVGLRDQRDPLRIPPGPLLSSGPQLLSNWAGSPGLRPPPYPFPQDLSPHPSLCDSRSRFLSLNPSPRNSGLFSKATWGPLSSPTQPGWLRSGVESGTRKEKGAHKARLTLRPPPPSHPHLCTAAKNQQTTGWKNNPPIPLLTWLPPRADPSPAKCIQEPKRTQDIAPTQSRRPQRRGRRLGQGRTRAWTS